MWASHFVTVVATWLLLLFYGCCFYCFEVTLSQYSSACQLLWLFWSVFISFSSFFFVLVFFYIKLCKYFLKSLFFTKFRQEVTIKLSSIEFSSCYSFVKGFFLSPVVSSFIYSKHVFVVKQNKIDFIKQKI